MKENEEIVFTAYEALLRPLPATQGGGFRMTVDISEDQYDQVKGLLDPTLKQTLLTIRITSRPM